MGKGRKKDEKKGIGLTGILILVLALGVMGYSGYKLAGYFLEYKEADDLYHSIREDFILPEGTPAGGVSGAAGDTDEESTVNGVNMVNGEEIPSVNPEAVKDMAHVPGGIEDAAVPLTVDWAALRASYPDAVGWIYMDAFPKTVNYPVVKGRDNDQYLHHAPNGSYLYAGSIFEDCDDAADFSDAVTTIYGHNMKNGSMFALLKRLKDQQVYDENPYFWILTPKGNYRYRIFAVFDTSPVSSAYAAFDSPGAEVLKWEQDMQNQSFVKISVPLFENDHTVILSTCTSGGERRTVVIARCCSTERPAFRDAEIGIS